MARTRLTDAGDDRVAEVAHTTCLVAQDTRTDAVGRSGRRLPAEHRIRDLGAGHLDKVGLAARDELLGESDVDDRALGYESDPFRQSGSHDRRRLAVETRLDMTVGPGGGGPERRAAHGTEVVEPQWSKDGQKACGGRRHDPRPFCKLVTRKPETDYSLDRGTIDGVSGGQDRPAHELDAVLAELVVAEVGEPRAELAQEAVLTGVQLHTVAACFDRRLSRDAESGDQGPDLVGLHGFGNFAGLHVGHRGRAEQDTLVIGARALASRVAERSDHEGALLVAGT